MKMRNPIATGMLLALAGATSAQQAPNNVTLYGVLDATFKYGSGSLATTRSLGSDGLAGSRWGIRGIEDLGGGKRATFVMESGFSPVTGATTAVMFNRQIFLALSSDQFGELAFGRQYTPTFLVHARYDAFGPQGAAAQQVLLGSIEMSQSANVRANNAINYTSPKGLGGFSLQAMVTASEGDATGKYSGLNAGYSKGPFSTLLAFGRYDNNSIGDLKSVTIGGSYKLDKLTVFALHDNANSGSSIDSKGTQMSLAYSLGVTTLKASLAQSDRMNAAGLSVGTTRRFGIGAVHDLSKRTAVYATVARVTNSNGAATALNGSKTAANSGSTGLDVGIRHSF
jgi:predicted porin